VTSDTTKNHKTIRNIVGPQTPFRTAGPPFICRLRLKCDGSFAETRYRLSAKLTSPFKSAGASVQSTTGSWGVRISSSNAGYTMFRGSVKSTGYRLHSPVSPSLLLPCVTVCHHILTELYRFSPSLVCTVHTLFHRPCYRIPPDISMHVHAYLRLCFLSGLRPCGGQIPTPRLDTKSIKSPTM
jgi:hypothetical protein